ncbi:hypothetical protein FA09DRAFT_128435 [Tilletiopsis washingtonensis]|uniref:Uncharacterized protein n=1 Tax=Tilletiopsis washingtonensis TaxID=58919 RepID=A0A316Z2W0_9BASI|nr:hypothetical protein FA09DRAFT_128435 [Tilletiopsis washingtonensis]PWN95871.1 hypothetical protein FA09DRAFT_128435 [Tilletiopsis washingtonensis]
MYRFDRVTGMLQVSRLCRDDVIASCEVSPCASPLALALLSPLQRALLNLQLIFLILLLISALLAVQQSDDALAGACQLLLDALRLLLDAAHLAERRVELLLLRGAQLEDLGGVRFLALQALLLRRIEVRLELSLLLGQQTDARELLLVELSETSKCRLMLVVERADRRQGTVVRRERRLLLLGCLRQLLQLARAAFVLLFLPSAEPALALDQVVRRVALLCVGA